jgi:serine protease Do
LLEEHVMTNQHTRTRSRTIRGGLAGGAIALMLAGAAWSGRAADQAAATTTTAEAVQSGGARIAGARQDSYADVVKVAAPAVVTIRVEARTRPSPTGFDDGDLFRRFFGQTPRRGRPDMPMPSVPRRGLGSGVIVTTDGYVLTNHHVIDGAEQIHVDLQDGRTEKATLVGSDKASDLALLKIDGTNFKSLTLGDSDAVQVGDVVLAVGNPLGIGQTVTMGIISAKGRETRLGDGGYEDFLQTDAPINHGNSGGALVNTKGELVGINSQILSVSEGNIGIGFAIPANMARHVMDELRTEGRVRRAQLGVTIQPITSNMADSLGLPEVKGAIVSGVTPGSAAERGGVQRGDVIMSFNGQPVQDTNALRNRVAAAEPGSKATLVIVRKGEERTLTVALDEAASADVTREARGSSDNTALGVAVAPVTPELAARAGIPEGTRGLLVREVVPDGKAADAGIQPGDVIQEVNQKPVQTVEELRNAVRSGSDRPALVLVSREGRSLYLTIS